MTQAWFDGACNPTNPGHGGWGFVVRADTGLLLAAEHGYLGPASTNNIAELTALLKLLEWLKANHYGTVEIHGDSRLAVMTAVGLWRAKAPHLRPLVARIRELIGGLSLRLSWIPREQNSEADEQSKLGSVPPTSPQEASSAA